MRAAGIKWKDYDNFMQKHIKTAGHDKTLKQIPPDLDIKPYHDEKDTKTLREMQKIVRKEISKYYCAGRATGVKSSGT